MRREAIADGITAPAGRLPRKGRFDMAELTNGDHGQSLRKGRRRRSLLLAATSTIIDRMEGSNRQRRIDQDQ